MIDEEDAASSSVFSTSCTAVYMLFFVGVVMQFNKKRMKPPHLIFSTCQYIAYKHTVHKIHYHSPYLNMYRMGDCFTKRLGPGHPLW